MYSVLYITNTDRRLQIAERTADGEDHEDRGYTAEKQASAVTVPRKI
jgi:hypothetical protein